MFSLDFGLVWLVAFFGTRPTLEQQGGINNVLCGVSKLTSL